MTFIGADHFSNNDYRMQKSPSDISSFPACMAQDARFDALITVHLVESDVRLRAHMARKLLQAGFHAEIYAEARELATFAPKSGIIFINDANHPDGLIGMMGDLGGVGLAMPIIVYGEKPTIGGVVAAMRARAVNYLSLDLPDAALCDAIRDAFREGEKSRSHQAQVVHSRKLLECLSQRERQVLELLVEGESNKGMARVLDISPRTVEIHRMKMMNKLGAKTTSHVVKIWCIANIEN